MAKCLRCGREYTNSVPEVTRPEGDHEIACVEYCSDCNKFVMNIIRRWGTAYIVSPGKMYDPLKGGAGCR